MGSARMATKADLQRFNPRPKAPAPRRSRPYREWVASLRCSYCNVQGFSQCAHPNKGGKAKGRKMDDGDAFPLCCERPGVVGCHSQHDQYRLLPAAEVEHYERAWAVQTQTLARVQGRWPKDWK